MSCLGIKEFEERVREIVSEDDVNKFDSYVAKIAALPCQHYPALLDLCLEHQALNCTLYLLQGNLPHGPPTLHHQLVHHHDCVPALFSALSSLPEPQLIHLLLSHCGAHLHVNQTIMDFYPLHFALAPLHKLDHLSNWSLGQSLIKLLHLLFLPQTRPTLECARLVAEYTNSVNEVALGFIQHGELMQLAGLLLVAHQKAMLPLSTGHTIKQGLSMDDVVLQVIHGEGCDTETTCAAGLFDMFDKAGDKLATYYKSMSENEPAADEVIVRVAEIIQSVGIQVLCTDVDLTDIKRSSINLADLSYICKRLGIEMDGTTKEVQMSRKSTFPSWKFWTRSLTRELPHDKCSKIKCQVESEFERLQTGEGYDVSARSLIGSRTYSTSSSRFGGKMESLGTRAFSTSSLIDKISSQHWNHSSSQLNSLGGRSFSTSCSISSRHSWTCPSVSGLCWLALKLKRGVRLV